MSLYLSDIENATQERKLTDEEFTLLRLLGTTYITDLVRRLRPLAAAQANKIKWFQKELDENLKITPEAVRQFQRESPPIDFPETIQVDGVLIPIDQMSIVRKDGWTTFRYCGWCEHKDRVFRRGDLAYLPFPHLTKCSIRDDEHVRGACHACDVLDDGGNRIREYQLKERENDRREQREAVQEKRAMDSNIRTLLGLRNNAPDRTFIPPLRRWLTTEKHLGQRVWFFTFWPEADPHNNTFIEGRLVVIGGHPVIVTKLPVNKEAPHILWGNADGAHMVFDYELEALRTAPELIPYWPWLGRKFDEWTAKNSKQLILALGRLLEQTAARQP